jgi:hypothetical protein
MSPALVWQRWREMPSIERRQFVIAAGLVPAMAVALRIVGFNRMQAWLNDVGTPAATAAPTPTVIRAAVLAISRVKRYGLYRGNCLSQSMTLVWLLKRRGAAPDLRLGVRLTGPKFDAHAWVELDGRVLNDTPDVHTRFTPLVSESDT